MKNLENRLPVLQEFCTSIGIDNVNFAQIYVITLWDNDIQLQGHYATTMVQLVKLNHPEAVTTITTNGYIHIDIKFKDEEFKIVLT
jgi:hypothetical protein